MAKFWPAEEITPKETTTLAKLTDSVYEVMSGAIENRMDPITMALLERNDRDIF